MRIKPRDFHVDPREAAAQLPPDVAKVRDVRAEGLLAGIAPHDSVERFESLGVTVLQGWG